MKSTRNAAGLDTHSQPTTKGQASSKTQQAQENTMVLVYPDGRVTNVKLRQKKFCS
ncbi:MAG: hypothetical protein AAGI45_07650 [Cyanobacteria bacterium P01_H01_bin.26]